MPCVISVSLREGPLGLPGRLEKEIGGKPLLHWTLKKAASLSIVSQVFVLAASSDFERIRKAAHEIPVELLERNFENAEKKRFVRLRKWAINSWQGGVADASVFSEELDPSGMLAVAKKTGAEYLVKVASYGPLTDAGFAEKMAEDLQEKFPLKLTNSPPGLAAEIYSVDILKKMQNARGGLEGLLRYDLAGLKTSPMPEPSTMGYFSLASQEVAFTRARFLGDTARSFALLEALNKKYGEDWVNKSADEIVAFYNSHAAVRRWKYPREIEFEISTFAEVPNPPRKALSARSNIFMKPEIIRRALDSMKEADDLCVTIGGYGDPLAHPDLAGILDAAKGAFGIHLHTDGALLDEKKIEILSKSAVDIITVDVDAATEETFKKIRGGKGTLGELAEKIRALAAACRPDGPLIIPSFTATQSTLSEQEQFFNTWYPEAGWVVAKRLDDMAGRIKEDVPLPLTLGKRGICEHLLERMFVRADGRIGACIQDVECLYPLQGNPAEAWNSPKISELISAHEKGDYEFFTTCAKCNRWCQW